MCVTSLSLPNKSTKTTYKVMKTGRIALIVAVVLVAAVMVDSMELPQMPPAVVEARCVTRCTQELKSTDANCKQDCIKEANEQLACISKCSGPADMRCIFGCALQGSGIPSQ